MPMWSQEEHKQSLCRLLYLGHQLPLLCLMKISGQHGWKRRLLGLVTTKAR